MNSRTLHQHVIVANTPFLHEDFLSHPRASVSFKTRIDFHVFDILQLLSCVMLFNKTNDDDNDDDDDDDDATFFGISKE